MAEQNQRRWVVVIQKKPRGPLTETEVNALLVKGLLLSNDLGFEIDVTTGKAISDWKMLWQFPEFDRRAKADAERAAKNLPPSPWVEKRGPAPSPEKIKEAVQQKLPNELLDIPPEELISKTHYQKNAGRLDTTDIELHEKQVKGMKEGGKSHFVYAVAFGVLLLSLVFKFILAPVKPQGSQAKAEGSQDPSVTATLSDESSPTTQVRTVNRALPGRPFNTSQRPSASAPIAREPEPSVESDERLSKQTSDRDDRDRDRDRGEVPRDFASKREKGWEVDEEEEPTEDVAYEKSRKAKKVKKNPRSLSEEDQDAPNETADADGEPPNDEEGDAP